jgi:heptosyltransferase-1
MKLLIVKLSSLGDVVHTLPALNALRQGFTKSAGNIEIDWLVEEAASGIITGHPMIDEVVVVKKGGWIKSAGENLRTARRLSNKNYDLVIDFQGLLKSGLWVKFIKSKRKLGFSNAREMSHLFLTEKLPAYDSEMHAVDRYMLLAVHALGGTCDGPVDFALKVEESTLKEVRAKLGELAGDKIVTLLPGARWKTKLWTAKGFGALAREIKERLALDVVIAGSRADTALAAEIVELSGGGTLNLAGNTTLKELTALLSLSKFVVTVDSGPMHIAAALGTPVVALFGPTKPGRTGPYGKGNIIIGGELDCAPCFKRECPEPVCMEGISSDQVMEVILSSSLVTDSTVGIGELKAKLS